MITICDPARPILHHRRTLLGIVVSLNSAGYGLTCQLSAQWLCVGVTATRWSKSCQRIPLNCG